MGLHLGKYELLQELARGGMGVVYLAKSLGAHGVLKFVALKVINKKDQANLNTFNELLYQEANAIINLSHQNIVNIFEFGLDQDTYYIAMEYVPGVNLFRFLKHLRSEGAKLGLDHILHMGCQAAAGLHAVHQLRNVATGQRFGLIHSDISPQNIMVSFYGDLKLIDFGVSRNKDAANSSPDFWGKVGYLSPEQANCLELDQRTDIYSLGVVLWELLMDSGPNLQPALKTRGNVDLIQALQETNSVPADVVAIIARAVALERDERYTTAGHLEMDLWKALIRHYPEFSPQEYSVFFESLFSQQILINRRMLKKFSTGESESLVEMEESPHYEDVETTAVLAEIPIVKKAN